MLSSSIPRRTRSGMPSAGSPTNQSGVRIAGQSGRPPVCRVAEEAGDEEWEDRTATGAAEAVERASFTRRSAPSAASRPKFRSNPRKVARCIVAIATRVAAGSIAQGSDPRWLGLETVGFSSVPGVTNEYARVANSRRGRLSIRGAPARGRGHRATTSSLFKTCTM